MTGVPLEHTDPRLEEKPRTLTCDEPKLPDRPSGGPYHSKAEADTAFAEWARQHQGTLRVRVVVRPDGKVIASQVKILENTNPVVKEALLRSIVSCRFAPGRSGGTPVAAFATTGATMHIDTP